MASAILLAVAIAASAYAVHNLWSPTIRVKAMTTISLYETGLLSYLAEEFAKSRGIAATFDFIPVGSGEALRRAELGDACIVFVHAPGLEKEYVQRGVLADHRILAYNFFLIAGPSTDPGMVREAADPVDAFRRIFEACEGGRALFISRGDNSGTHQREMALWRRAGLDPRGRPWYLETCGGMQSSLLVANEKRAYILSDFATYLMLRREGRIGDLEVLYSGGDELMNIYSVYVVAACSGPQRALAAEFVDFVGGEAQSLIAGYGVSEFGQPLFNPAKGDLERLRLAWEEISSLEGG